MTNMNVFDYLFDSSQYLDKDFVLGSKETISFKELYENSLKVAAYLNETIGTGQNVILLSPNSVFFITAYLGILKSGNVCVPLNFDIEQNNLEYILNETESRLVFISKSYKSRFRFDSPIQLIDEDDSFQLNINKDVLNETNNELAEIIFTSGSSGKPKGVMISHQNIIANTNAIIDYLNLTSSDIMAVVLPFFYCYGLSLLHTHLKAGGSIVLNNNFIFLGSFLSDLLKYKCTGFAGVPSHFQILLKKSQSFKTTTFEHLRYMTQAGGKLHAVFIKDLIITFPKMDFYVMYGQTEATARLSFVSPNQLAAKTHSIGKAIEGVTLKVVNEKGDQVGLNEEGELIAKGENIMLGYFKDKQNTNQTIKNGWLYTGDIAKMDSDGYFYLVARKKEIIKVGGKRVSPKEIEEVILSITEVVDCAISAIEDHLLGESIQASIVLTQNFDHQMMKDKIREICSKNLAQYKIPQNIIIEKTIHMSATGKKIKKSNSEI